MATTQTDRNNATPSSIQNDGASGLYSSTAFKGPVRVRVSTNVTLSGEQTLDGVACVAGDRVLLTGQTDQTTNGIYVVSTGEWQRAADFNRNDDVVKGTAVRVTEGTYDGIWVLTTSNPVTFDSSNLTFVQSDIGPQGIQGDQGDPGNDGADATITIGTVTTVDPGDPATVTNVGTATAAIFDFEIPKGDTGASGAGSGDLLSTNNLSDLANAATARTNLGLGTIATQAAPAGTVVGTSDTQTLTNKRINPRVSATASTATLTVDSDSYDQACVTAQAQALTIAAPTGTPVQGQRLIVRLKDNGTARALTWNAIFRAIGITLPTTTTLSKTTYVGFIYNATDTKWDAVATVTEA